MATPTVPPTINALKTGENKSVTLTSVPFGTLPEVSNLAPDHILVRTTAVGLNPTDWKHAFGEWGGPGYVCGCDAAGEVVQVGSKVTRLRVGDRIAGFTYGTSQENNGAFAEYVRFDQAVTMKLPERLSHLEGASLPIPFLTAMQALYFRFNLPLPSKPFTENRPTILIWGGSTAVGHHSIQLAAKSGLRVFATASPAVHEDIKALGAHEVFDYRDPDVVKKIIHSAGSEGISYAYDTVCDKGSTDLAVDAIKSDGGVVITTLPPSKETEARRPNVRVEFSLVYTLLGYGLTFAHAVTFPDMPQDRQSSQTFLETEFNQVMDGNYKMQKLRKISGGLKAVPDALRIMQKGEYGREKLVVEF